MLLCLALICVLALSNDKSKKPKKKKDIRDYNDADMARLLEEWEVNYPSCFCKSGSLQFVACGLNCTFCVCVKYIFNYFPIPFISFSLVTCTVCLS